MTQEKIYDALIIGGGMSGLTLALALAKTGRKVACIDRDDPKKQLAPEFDGRTIAISAGSAHAMQAAGVWEALRPDACPIHEIQITDSGSATLLDFLSKEIGDQSFGHIVENRCVRQCLFAAADAEKNLDHLAPQKAESFRILEDHAEVTLEDKTVLRSKLLVGADGRGSWVREEAKIRTRGWSYHQQAVICTVEHEHPHNYIALEDFRPEGPFAVLPMTDGKNGAHRSSVVWTEHGSRRRSAMNLSEDDFNSRLNELFPVFYGQVTRITPAQVYPLSLIHAEKYTSARLALVADAAHGIHPIAGQGLNIGLRDVLELVKLSEDYDDMGDPRLLKAYERARRIDNMAMIFATDSINKLFSNNIAPVRLARRAGLRAVGKLPFAKKFFMKQAMGLR